MMNHLFLLKKILFFSFVMVSSISIARESDDEVQQVRVGNFAVPGTTQPGTASGFGQNIIDQYSTLGIFYPYMTLGKNQNFTQIISEVIYGIRDDLSILLAFPTAVKLKYDGHHSSGSLDAIVQMEYAPYMKQMPTYTNQISLVGSVTLPTGNECKIPATGYGSPSFFLGFVAVHLATEWYAYTSLGGVLTTKNNIDIRWGNQFIYQAGFGRNIAYAPDRWTLMWMLELNGTYQKKTQKDSIIGNNSGSNTIPVGLFIGNNSKSNTITVGPSLWFSTNRFVLEIGAVPIVYQNFSDEQLKSSCVITIYTGCRFN